MPSQNQDPPESNATIMHVKIFSPAEVYFDGPALSVSAVNDTGAFDILLSHHNFITLLNPCDVDIITQSNEHTKIKIKNGVMHVKMNVITIFLDI